MAMRVKTSNPFVPPTDPFNVGQWGAKIVGALLVVLTFGAAMWLKRKAEAATQIQMPSVNTESW